MSFANLQFAMRLFFKNGLTSAIAILVLAIGLGLSISMFTLSHMMLWDTPAVNKSKELVTLEWARERTPGQMVDITIHILDLIEFKKTNTSFEQLSSIHQVSLPVYNPDAKGVARNYSVARTDENFFKLVDAKPMLGRIYDENDLFGEMVVVISHQIWQQEYGGEGDVIGKSLLLNGEVATVIGVMPEGFAFPLNEKLWRLHDFAFEKQRGREFSGGAITAGLLKPGVDAAMAEIEFHNLAANLSKTYPATNKELTNIKIGPINELFSNPALVAMIMMLLIGSGFVLLIACANVSNLILARVSKRQFELSMRRVLGANKREICFQVLLDALIIGVIGVAFGFLLAGWANRAIWTILNDAYARFTPYWWSMDMSPEVIIFGIVTMLIAVAVSSASTLMKVLKRHNIEAIKDNSRTSSGFATSKIGKVLVCIQVMLTVVLLITASYFTLVSDYNSQLDLPYDANQRLINNIRIAKQAGFDTEESVLGFYDQIQRGIKAIPGVDNVGFSSFVYNSQGTRGARKFQIDGKPVDPKVNNQRAAVNIINPSYFDVMNGEVILGRGINETDTKDSLPVVVVNQHFVNEFFPNENPLGKKVQFKTPGFSWEPQNQNKPKTQWLTIVGVTSSLQSDKGIEIARKSGDIVRYLVAYMPMKQWVARVMNIVVSGQGDVTQYAKQVATVISQASTSIAPFGEYQTIQEQINESMTFIVLLNQLVMIFALVALVMAAAGLYGIASFTAELKKREYGIHMALGASKLVVIGLVFKSAKLQILIGMVLGGLLAFALNRLLNQQIGGGVENVVELFSEVMIYASSITLVLFILALAMLLPALRQANIPPNVSLRSN